MLVPDSKCGYLAQEPDVSKNHDYGEAEKLTGDSTPILVRQRGELGA